MGKYKTNSEEIEQIKDDVDTLINILNQFHINQGQINDNLYSQKKRLKNKNQVRVTISDLVSKKQ